MNKKKLREKYGAGYYWAKIGDEVVLIRIRISSVITIWSIGWEGMTPPENIDEIIEEIQKPKMDGD